MISIRLRGIQNYSDMKRYGSVIRVRPEKLEEYKKLNAACVITVSITKTDFCSVITNMSATTMRPIWQKWLPIPRHSVGGLSANRASNRSTLAPKASGGPRWKRYSTKTEHRSASFGFIVSGLIFLEISCISAQQVLEYVSGTAWMGFNFSRLLGSR